MPIDLATVNWEYVFLISGFVFIASLVGGGISFRNKLVAAIIAAVIFGVGFVFWTYYPHDLLPAPLSTWPISAR